VFRQLTENTDEGKQTNFFGRYSSQLVKDWQMLIRIYEYENLYLGELCKVVQQMCAFEMPALRKQQTTMAKTLTENINK